MSRLDHDGGEREHWGFYQGILCFEREGDE